MAVRITNVKYFDDWNVASCPYLLGNVQDRQRIEIDFAIDFFAVAITNEQEIVLGPSAVNGTNITNNIIQSDNPLFTDFKVGDEIRIVGTLFNNSNRFITEILDEYTIRCTGTFTTETAPNGAYVALITPVTGIRYFYNFTENGQDSFESLIDGESPQLKIGTADPSNLLLQTMQFTGKKSYQIGNCTIQGLGIVSDSQTFRIVHNTTILPDYLSGQFQDLTNRVNPDYFEAQNCLKHLFKITASRNLNDPNRVQESETYVQLGNTGWHNENFNAGSPNYSLYSYSITRVSDSEPLQSIDINDECDALITLRSVVGSNFSNGNTKVGVNFTFLPEEIDNSVNYKTNYLFDYGLNTLGSTTTSDLFGTSLQTIKEIQTTFVSASEITVRVRFNLASGVKSKLLALDVRRYKLSVSVQNHTLVRETSDRVNILVDVNDFGVQLTSADLITSSTQFVQHPFSNYDDGATKIRCFPVDDVSAQTKFSIDFAGRETDEIKIISISNQVVAKHSTQPTIILDSIDVDTQASLLEDGLAPLINISQNRVFKIPAGEVRKVFTVNRNTAEDSGLTYSWKVNYPYMMRWEFWKKLVVNFLPTSIFDPTEPNNGLNHEWLRIANASGWTLNYRLKFILEQNGQQFQQIFDKELFMADFKSNPDWINESIKSYFDGTNTEIISGPDKYLLGYVDTRIEASFEYVGSNPPLLTEMDISFFIERKEAGGIGDAPRASSVYEYDNQTWFKSLDASKKVQVTKVGNIYTGKILVDFSKLPTNTEAFTIYARLHDKRRTPLFV